MLSPADLHKALRRCPRDVGTVHPPGSAVDYVRDAVYVLMVFQTDFEVLTVDGMQRGRAGQLFINAPGTRQCHRGIDGAGFTNDWIHIDASLADPWVSELGLPLNQILSVSRPDYLRLAIRELQREQAANAPHYHRLMALKIHELLLLTSRYLVLQQRMKESAAEQRHYEDLCALRLDMQMHCDQDWTVPAMARRARLSANRFAVLYRRFFDATPIEDLIEARLRRAANLLLTEGMKIADIARSCGFTDPNYFSRQFRARRGMSPQDYRNAR